MRSRLLWELRYRRDEFSIEAGRAKGRDYPDWFLECPELMPFEYTYLRAFWDLRSEAKDGDSTVGRIPWSKARDYGARELGFDESLLSYFWLIISSMDTGFREWMSSEYARHSKKSGDKTTTVGNRSTSKRTYAR